MKYITFLFIIIFASNLIYCEKFDIIKIRTDVFKKELKLDPDQEKKLYEIFTEEDNYNKKKNTDLNNGVPSNGKNNPVIDLLREAENNYKIFDDRVNEILSLEQYNKYFDVKMNYIKNKVTIYLKTELLLTSKQAVDINVIVETLFSKTESGKVIMNIKPKDKSNNSSSDNTQPQQDKLSDELLSTFQKELINFLSSDQVNIFNEKKAAIFKFLQSEVAGVIIKTSLPAN